MMAQLHDRMPVILKPEDYEAWLTDADRASGLLGQYPGDELEAIEVGKGVGNVKNDNPECVEPIE
jgi:putative SOS response-associated peptidase YedK